MRIISDVITGAFLFIRALIIIVGILIIVGGFFGDNSAIQQTTLFTAASAIFLLVAVTFLGQIVNYLIDIRNELSQLNERDKKMAQWQIKQQQLNKK